MLDSPYQGSRTGLTPPISTSVPGTPQLALRTRRSSRKAGAPQPQAAYFSVTGAHSRGVKSQPARPRSILNPALTFHDDGTASLQLYKDRTWYCFGACKAEGSIFDFASRVFGLEEQKARLPRASWSAHRRAPHRRHIAAGGGATVNSWWRTCAAICVSGLGQRRRCGAHSTYTSAGGGTVLTISTVLPQRDLAIELISTYVGHPHTPTIVTHLMLGPPGRTAQIRSLERAHEDLDGTYGQTNYVTAASTPDGKLAMAYVPGIRRAHGCAQRLFRVGHRPVVRPCERGLQGDRGNPFANSGSVSVSTPGANATGDGDWYSCSKRPDAQGSAARAPLC